MISNSFVKLFWVVLFFSALKFIIMYCIPYFVFWKVFPKKFWHLKIQQVERIPPQIRYEIKFSLLTLILQSLFLTFLFWGSEQGFLKLHWGFGSQGFAVEAIAFLSYFIIYDMYFYWSHRFLHWGWFYKNVHNVHHRSMNPTPFAAYSFHPIETFVSVFYMLPFVFLFPVSYELFFVLLIITDISNLGGHLGYELLPRSVYNSKLGGWLTTPTHHNLHHQYSKTNFALYWRGWDKHFQTLHPKTETEFYRIKDQKDSVSTSA